MLYEAEFWVAVAFVLLVLGLFKLGVHKTVAGALDDRTARIRAELDEAQRLRAEAEALLAEYRRRRQEAEAEAAAIVANAQAEGERLQSEAKAKVEEFVARRTKMAETKIAQAEAQAIADVRSAAADAAVAAAETLLTETVKGKLAGQLVTDGIKGLAARLN
ncbi:ATP F0F1 synthase subunit B [Rhodoplanes serenus]|jgi:F-type H+-transporting ATPase subunit b|uniref:F0F1 ATP synthase subunit B family protein n=1 Tax=Rhodoplanes serenus TaxID=200615 RepID=UPI000DAF2E2E|nr:ATP F0F1 synthase subunit B [Rhodoplanes serenus]RAI29447.1 ATP F0F1 synthase subunit B [Rhodoplanes serenus]